MKFKLFLISLVAVFFTSCSMDYMDLNPAFAENEIFGVWVDTVALSPQGYAVNELDFSKNGMFVAATRNYGMHATQSVNDLSGYFEYYGNYVLTAKNIYFASKQNVSWDGSTAASPVTTQKDEVIFESCTYKISHDTLEISYLTYPADAPVVTTRKYIKSE